MSVNRFTWILLIALLASNAAWFFASRAQDEPATGSDPAASKRLTELETEPRATLEREAALAAKAPASGPTLEAAAQAAKRLAGRR